jgi:hypothetical protein
MKTKGIADLPTDSPTNLPTEFEDKIDYKAGKQSSDSVNDFLAPTKVEQAIKIAKDTSPLVSNRRQAKR